MLVYVYVAKNMCYFFGYTNVDNGTLCVLLTWKYLLMRLCVGVRILPQP